jgi:hypothetical protein
MMQRLCRLLSSCFVTLLLLLSISTISTILFLSLIDNNTTSAQQETTLGAPVTIIPAITQNILTLVSLLIGTSSFLLGLRIQSAGKRTTTELTSPSTLTSSIRNKYFELLILALVIPALINIIYGIVLVGSHLFPGESSYLLLLFTLFVPAVAELFLVRKLHIGTLK